MNSGSIEEVLQIASFPPDVALHVNSPDYEEMYKYIRAYYSASDKHIEPMECRIGDDFSTETSIGVVPESPTNIKRVEVTDYSFSNYDVDALERIGIDTSDIWNGRVAAGTYKPDGTLEIAETDYYTITFFGHSLMVESILVSQNTPFNRDIEGSNMLVRDRFAPDVSEFSDKPWFATGVTSGGIILNSDRDRVEILLGKRTQNPLVNKGMYSIVPNGIVTPNQLSGDSLENSVRDRFETEAFSYRKKGSEFFDSHVESWHVMTAWNLRHASLSSVYCLEVDDKENYDRLMEQSESNMEFDKFTSLDVTDVDEVTEFLNHNPVSPIAVSAISRLLEVIDSDDSMTDLPYKVRTTIP